MAVLVASHRPSDRTLFFQRLQRSEIVPRQHARLWEHPSQHLRERASHVRREASGGVRRVWGECPELVTVLRQRTRALQIPHACNPYQPPVFRALLKESVRYLGMPLMRRWNSGNTTSAHLRNHAADCRQLLDEHLGHGDIENFFNRMIGQSSRPQRLERETESQIDKDDIRRNVEHRRK